jgi:hypothetical protein
MTKKTTDVSLLGRIIWGLLVTAGELFAVAGIIMVFLGSAHSEDARVPALGYWATFSLAAALVIAYRVLVAAQEIREDI